MKNMTVSARVSMLILICFLSSVFLPLSYAAVPHLLNYQGRLTDSGGAPLNGTYALTFRIYDAETAGTMLWEETQAGVVIQKGIFNILLGSVTNLGLPFDKPYWLEIKVGNEVMSPRQAITSSGYAIRAEEADNAKESEKLGGQQPAYYLDHGSSTGLSDNDHPQYVRGQNTGFKIDSGITGLIPGGSQTGRSVSFNFTFSSPPLVILTVYDPTYGHGIGGDSGYFVQSVSQTGFTFGHYNAANAVYYYWIAIGQVPQ